MATEEAKKKRPLWLAMEEQILALESEDLSGANLEAAIHRIAGELDNTGYNVSGHGGNLMELRWAVDKMQKVGSPLLKDLTTAISTFTLEDLTDAYAATSKMLEDIGKTWPELNTAARRPDVVGMIEKARLDLLVAKAKTLPDDKGIRLLIAKNVAPKTIIASMEITEERLKEVNELIAAEQAERDRVAGLLEKVAEKSIQDQVKHLFENNVTEELIIEMAKVDQGVIDGVKKAMEEELREKERLAAEEAERKRKEAEGPALEDIPPEDMLGYIESIREIMEFSDQEKDIRVMCEQSQIPKALVDIAVSDAAKLDELEKKAGG